MASSKECIVASGNGCSNHDGDGVRLLLQSVSITSELFFRDWWEEQDLFLVPFNDFPNRWFTGDDGDVIMLLWIMMMIMMMISIVPRINDYAP